MRRSLIPLLLLGCAAIHAQGSDWILAHYRKQEVLIPMRDGTRLFTIIYTPRDPSRTFPVLLQRTPYAAGPYGRDAIAATLGPSPAFAREGFIFVNQDVRGKMMSEGTFVDMTPCRDGQGIDEATDTYDTVDWVLAHIPRNNGRVGQWGISYPAFYTAEAMCAAHPAMKAVSPQAPIVDWFVGDDFHRNGALWLPHTFNFFATMGRPRPVPTPDWPMPFRHGTRDGYAFFLGLGPLTQVDARFFHGGIPFWNDVMAHGTYDAFWKARDLRPHIRNVSPAVLTVGGWFDAEDLFGTLQVHRALDRQSPGTEHHLVMGPWSHGGWSWNTGDRLGILRFGSPTAEYFQARIEFPFFMHHLKDAPDPGLPAATVFQTGTNRWLAFPAWPPPEARPRDLCFGKDGLSFRGPAADGFRAWVSDPAQPVPYLDRAAITMEPDYMCADQRFAERRPDVLTFRTPPLEADLAVAGPVRADLFVSTTGTDADWVVKVIDVHLDGCEQLVRGEPMRGKFRDSFETPVPFVPGRPTEVAFALNDICHTFRKGHRVMVQVQSTWFPLMDRNPQVFTDIYHARPEDFRKAEHRLWFGPAHPSRLTFQVLP